MNSYNLSKIQETLNKVHPKQVVNRLNFDCKISLHEVKYEYITNRSNKKEGIKYFLLNELNPNPDYNKELESFMKNYNEENKHRQISNVKFLDGKCLGYINI